VSARDKQSHEPDAAPAFEWRAGQPAQLWLKGSWTITHLARLEKSLLKICNDKAGNQDFELDMRDIDQLDTAGAYLIDRTLREIAQDAEIEIAARPIHFALLQQARRLVLEDSENRPEQKPAGYGLMRLLERTGQGLEQFWQEVLLTLSFFGAVMVSIFMVIWIPTRMRWTALIAVMEEAGLDAVPIVAFLSFFVGMVVAFIGATTLSEFGATIFVVELTGYGILRELGGVLVAIIIAGRTNSAFTAQIGAMKMRQEIDAMNTLGLDPMYVLVAPRAIAMMIMLPVLTFIGMLTGIAGGMAVGWLALDIPPVVFLNRMQDYVPLSQFWIGMSKAPVFGLTIALIACRQGLEVAGSVRSLGHHTTKSVVQALFAIIVIDALFAIFYMELGL